MFGDLSCLRSNATGMTLGRGDGNRDDGLLKTEGSLCGLI